jgi:hypothetical protein
MVASFLALALLVAQEPSAPAVDACAKLIPKAVQQVVAEHVGTYDLPRESDNLPDDIRFDRSRGGTGCLGVAVGRFLGKPTNDYALLVTAHPDEYVLLLLVTKSGGAWRIELLHDMGKSTRNRLFVATLPPGHYKEYDCCEPGEPRVAPDGSVRQFTSARPGIGMGLIEAAESITFFFKGRWLTLALSD